MTPVKPHGAGACLSDAVEMEFAAMLVQSAPPRRTLSSLDKGLSLATRQVHFACYLISFHTAKSMEANVTLLIVPYNHDDLMYWSNLITRVRQPTPAPGWTSTPRTVCAALTQA